MCLFYPGRSRGLADVSPCPATCVSPWKKCLSRSSTCRPQKGAGELAHLPIAWAEGIGRWQRLHRNLPHQCLHPVGHGFEFPNLLRNGTLAKILAQRPQLKYLMLHNLDTLGAHLIRAGGAAHPRGGVPSFEVIPRRIEDRGGGLACVNGQVRLVEGLAMPRDEDEFHLKYYNSMTTWITLDRLLEVFGLLRDDLADDAKVTTAIRRLSLRLPTYIALKEVKKRLGPWTGGCLSGGPI